MSKDLTPDAWITSFAQATGTVSFPIGSIANLTSGDCDSTTGDIRNVLLKLLIQLKSHQDGLAAANRPATMTIRSTGNSTSTNFQILFTGTPSVFTLDTEPV